MPKLDLTVTVSVIIALCSIISPIITTIINNKHQTIHKKIELSEQRYQNTIIYKRNIFENYLKYAGSCITNPNRTTLSEYGERYLLALMYAPTDIQNDMKNAHNHIKNRKWETAKNIFEELTPKIQNLLQTL